MKTLSAILLGLACLGASPLCAENSPCMCKDCPCATRGHCGCYSNQGCACHEQGYCNTNNYQNSK